MSWVTVIWSIGSGACLTLALMNCVIWWKDRTARANLVFSVMAIAVAIFAALELALMRAQTSEQFSERGTVVTCSGVGDDRIARGLCASLLAGWSTMARVDGRR